MALRGSDDFLTPTTDVPGPAPTLSSGQDTRARWWDAPHVRRPCKVGRAGWLDAEERLERRRWRHGIRVWNDATDAPWAPPMIRNS